MARRKQPGTGGQKGKDGKRPRAFHRGRAQGKINDKLMRDTLEPAYAAAEAMRADDLATSKRTQAEMKDWADVLRQLDRSARYVPVFASCLL